MFIGGIGEISPFSFLNALQLSAKYEFLSGGSISIPLIRIVGEPVNFNLVASSFDATFLTIFLLLFFLHLILLGASLRKD